jgi:transposase-like protein
MTIAIARDPIYGNRFQSEIIELCVRWHLRYRLSYRDLVEMMSERGIAISHSAILRWEPCARWHRITWGILCGRREKGPLKTPLQSCDLL